MTRYEQGWKRAREMVKQKAAARRRRRLIGKVVSVFVLGVIAGMTLFGLMGCASSQLAVKGPLVELGDHQTLRGLVRISQMGEDCHSESEALRQTIADIFVGADLPRPQSVEVRPLAGSSYCGFAQGTASEVTTLELGARNTAVAEVTLYWSVIAETDLQKAQGILDAMRPVSAAASKTAKNPANK